MIKNQLENQPKNQEELKNQRLQEEEVKRNDIFTLKILTTLSFLILSF